MEARMKLGDKVTRTVDGIVYHGIVVDVFEDIVFVRWDTGMVSVLDEANTVSEKLAYQAA